MRVTDQHGGQEHGGPEWLKYDIFHFYLPVSASLHSNALAEDDELHGQSSMQFRITIRLVIGRRVGGQAKILARPGTHVDVLAALAAKGTKRIAGRIHTGTAATGARHLSRRCRVFFHVENEVRGDEERNAVSA